jgi:hypothetical protein
MLKQAVSSLAKKDTVTARSLRDGARFVEIATACAAAAWIGGCSSPLDGVPGAKTLAQEDPMGPKIVIDYGDGSGDGTGGDTATGAAVPSPSGSVSGSSAPASPPASAPTPRMLSAVQNAACKKPSIECGGACIDPQTDANNCGACGVDCGGGACVSGACQPVDIDSSLMHPTSLQLLDGQPLVIDGRDVISISNGNVPDTLTLLAPGTVSPVVTDDGVFAFNATGDIDWTPWDGGASVVATALGGGWLGAGAGIVHWVTSTTGGDVIGLAAYRDGSWTRTVPLLTTARAMAYDDHAIYVATSDQRIVRVDRAQSTATLTDLAHGVSADMLALGAFDLYWYSHVDGALHTLDLATNQELAAVPLPAAPTAIAADADGAYMAVSRSHTRTDVMVAWRSEAGATTLATVPYRIDAMTSNGAALFWLDGRTLTRLVR